METRITLLDKVCGEYDINLARSYTTNIHLRRIMVMLWISSIQRYCSAHVEQQSKSFVGYVCPRWV